MASPASQSPRHSNSVLRDRSNHVQLQDPEQGHEHTTFLRDDVERVGVSLNRSWSKFTRKGRKSIGVVQSLKAIALSSCLYSYGISKALFLNGIDRVEHIPCIPTYRLGRPFFKKEWHHESRIEECVHLSVFSLLVGR